MHLGIIYVQVVCVAERFISVDSLWSYILTPCLTTAAHLPFLRDLPCDFVTETTVITCDKSKFVTPVRAPRSKSRAYVIYFPVNVIQCPFPVLFPRIALEYPIWTQDAYFLCIKSCYVHPNVHIEFWLDVFVTPTPIRCFIWQHNCIHRQCDCVTIAK